MEVPENPDECRELLKKVVTDCGTDINKKPITITVFRGSCFNDFYRHFRKPWIEKKGLAADTKLSSLVKMLLMRVVFQGNFIQVGRVLRFYAGRQGLKKISLLLFSLSVAVALLGGVL